MEPTQKDWFRKFANEKEFDQNLQICIYQCEDDDPLTRLAQGVNYLCDIEFTTHVAYSSLKDWTVNGKKLKRLDYVVEMLPSGASNEFRVIYKGKALGSQDVKTEFQ